MDISKSLENHMDSFPNRNKLKAPEAQSCLQLVLQAPFDCVLQKAPRQIHSSNPNTPVNNHHENYTMLMYMHAKLSLIYYLENFSVINI